MQKLNAFFMLAGRILISLIFFFDAYQKITHWDETLSAFASKGIPETSIALFTACIIEFFGALALLVGFKVRLAALVMALYMGTMLYLFQGNFLKPSGESLIFFLQNLALLGALFYVASSGAGEWSIDRD